MKLPAVWSIGIGVATAVVIGATMLRRVKSGKWSLILTDLYSFFLLVWSVLVSLPYLNGDGMLVHTDKWRITLGAPLMFALSVLVNSVIGFWLFSIGYALFNPNRIRQVNLKLFGIEINNSLQAEDTILAEASNSAVALVERMNFVDEMLREFVWFYARQLSWKLKAPEDQQPEVLRQTVEDLLIKVYSGIRHASFSIYVLPLTVQGLAGLDGDLQAILRATDDGNDHQSGIVNNIGLSLHRLADSRYDTAIVIKPKGDYELSGLEVHGITMFFLSLVRTVANPEDDFSDNEENITILQFAKE